MLHFQPSKYVKTFLAGRIFSLLSLHYEVDILNTTRTTLLSNLLKMFLKGRFIFHLMKPVFRKIIGKKMVEDFQLFVERRILANKNQLILHCVKSVRIRSYSRPHFPAVRLNSERYEVYLHIQSEYGKMRTRITPNNND